MSLKKRRVLVVDWDRAVAETVVLVLNAGGFEAVAAFSGEEALLKAAQCSFDVLLADVMMEPVDGIQTALAFLQLQPAARVVLFSSSEGASTILMEAVKDGHDFPVLAKPIHPEELFFHLRGEQRTDEDTPA